MTKIVCILLISAIITTTVQCDLFVKTDHRDATNRLLIKRDTTADKIPKPEIYSFTIDSNIKYRYATTVVSHRVANLANVSQEVVFQFSLPDEAFISKFLMEIEGKVYLAYVKEKAEAKKVYEEAKSAGHSAAHVELSARDSSQFTVSLSLEAQSKGTFNLTYEQLLQRSLGVYENVISVFPTQVVQNLKVIVNVEESSKIAVFGISELKTENEISDDFIPNKLAVVEKSDNKGKIVWSPTVKEQQAISEDGVKGQLVVRYDVDRSADPNQIILDDGYFVHFFAPPDLPTLPKHVTFVLDVSGSMSLRKIQQLREAMRYILNETSTDDYFSIILFTDGFQVWAPGNQTEGDLMDYDYVEHKTKEVKFSEKFIIKATKENVAKAIEFTDDLNALSGTNIIAGLRASIALAKVGQSSQIKGYEPVIIFLTDGQPNVEMSDTDEIIKTVSALNTNSYPIFSLALGNDADFSFLKKLSLKNSGFARKIYVASDTSLQLKNFYKEVASPLLTNITFKYIPSEVDETTVTKRKFPTYFAGGELVILGKATTNNLTVDVSAHTTSCDLCSPFPPMQILLPTPKESQPNGHGHLEKMWAFQYIKELLDLHSLQDTENSTYKDKALDLSLKFSFVTELTSLVVVKPNATELPSSSQAQHPLQDLLPTALAGGGALYSSVPVAYDTSGLQYMPMSGVPPMAIPPPLMRQKTSYTQMTKGSSITSTFRPLLLSPTPYPELHLSDVIWLNNITTGVHLPNGTYAMLNPTPSDLSFQPCVLPSNWAVTGHCKHLQNCVLKEIIQSIKDFEPFACIVENQFLGVCCPDDNNSTVAGT